MKHIKPNAIISTNVCIWNKRQIHRGIVKWFGGFVSAVVDNCFFENNMRQAVDCFFKAAGLYDSKAEICTDGLIWEKLTGINPRDGASILAVEQNIVITLNLAQRGCVLETDRIKLEGVSQELIYNGDVRRAYLSGNSESLR